MEKKRKREKNVPNGGLSDGHNAQDSSLKEFEHKDSTDCPAAALPVPLQPWHAALGAANVTQSHHQETSGIVPRTCWPFGDFPHPPRPFYPMPPTPTTEWNIQNSSNSQPGNTPPYFAGPWFAPPYMGAPYPAFYGYPMPVMQKGIMKLPQGLSQKHQKLWEMQSSENIQLWSTVARLEAEMASQRSKITQLETDLQALKTARKDNPSIDAVVSAPSTQAAAPKRGRYKKTVIGNIPPEAIAPRPRGRKPAAEKPSLAKKAAEKGRLAAAAKVEGNSEPCPKLSSKENGVQENKPMINFETDTEKLPNFVSHSNMMTPNWTQANGNASQEEDDDEIMF